MSNLLAGSFAEGVGNGGLAEDKQALPAAHEYRPLSAWKGIIPDDLTQLLEESGLKPDDKIFFPTEWFDGYPPYGIFWNAAGAGSFPTEVFTVEHFSHLCPPSLKNHGIDFILRDQHFAWDPGAGPLAIAVSNKLAETGTPPPVHFSCLNRLVIDKNRSLQHPLSIADIQDRIPIPGNQNLDPAEADRRKTQIHVPYWAMRELLTRTTCCLTTISFHSMARTLAFDSTGKASVKDRPDWAFLFDESKPFQVGIAQCVGESFRRQGHTNILYNDPYNPTGIPGTVNHAVHNALMVEVCIPITCTDQHHVICTNKIAALSSVMSQAIIEARPVAHRMMAAKPAERRVVHE